MIDPPRGECSAHVNRGRLCSRTVRQRRRTVRWPSGGGVRRIEQEHRGAGSEVKFHQLGTLSDFLAGHAHLLWEGVKSEREAIFARRVEVAEGEGRCGQRSLMRLEGRIRRLNEGHSSLHFCGELGGL